MTSALVATGSPASLPGPGRPSPPHAAIGWNRASRLKGRLQFVRHLDMVGRLGLDRHRDLLSQDKARVAEPTGTEA
jgi:hypothetical protein